MLRQLVLLFTVVAATQAAGSWSEANTVSDDVMEIANWATAKLTASNDGLQHTVVTVKNIKTQIVAGMNYKFTLDVVVNHADNTNEYKSCDMTVFDQSWTNTRYFIEAPVCKSTSSPINRSLGGWKEQTAVTDDVMDLARWSTAQLSPYTNGLDHTIVTVRNIKTQVVAGMNYKFTLDVVASLPDNKYEMRSCDLTIHEQKWSNTRYFIDAPVCRKTNGVAQRLAGAWSKPTNVVGGDVMDLAVWTTSQLASYTGAIDHTMMTVKNIQTQVVNGINYKFTLDVVETVEGPKYNFKSCEITVYEQKWTNTRQFIDAPVCKNMQ